MEEPKKYVSAEERNKLYRKRVSPTKSYVDESGEYIEVADDGTLINEATPPPQPNLRKPVTGKPGVVTTGQTGMSGLIEGLPAHQVNPSVAQPRPAELKPAPKSFEENLKPKKEPFIQEQAPIKALPPKQRAAEFDKQFAGKPIQVGKYKMALPSADAFRTQPLNAAFLQYGQEAGLIKVADDGNVYAINDDGTVASHPISKVTQELDSNGMPKVVPIRYYDPLSATTFGLLGSPGAQPTPQEPGNEGFWTGLARGALQPLTEINKLGVNIGASNDKNPAYYTDANSVLNPELQSGAGRFAGYTLGSLPGAALASGGATQLASRIGAAPAVASAIGGGVAGGLLNLAPQINEVYAGSQTPQQATVNTLLGIAGGGIGNTAAYKTFGSGMSMPSKFATQAITDAIIGGATPPVSAVLNGTQMPTAGQIAQSAFMNVVPGIGLGLGGILGGLKRNQAKINAVKEANNVNALAVNEAATQKTAEQQQALNNWAEYTKGVGQKDLPVILNDFAGLSKKTIGEGEGKTISEADAFAKLAKSYTEITGIDASTLTPSELGAKMLSLKMQPNGPVAPENSNLYNAVKANLNGIETGKIKLEDLNLPVTGFSKELVAGTIKAVKADIKTAEAEAKVSAKKTEEAESAIVAEAMDTVMPKLTALYDEFVKTYPQYKKAKTPLLDIAGMIANRPINNEQEANAIVSKFALANGKEKTMQLMGERATAMDNALQLDAIAKAEQNTAKKVGELAKPLGIALKGADIPSLDAELRYNGFDSVEQFLNLGATSKNDAIAITNGMEQSQAKNLLDGWGIPIKQMTPLGTLRDHIAKTILASNGKTTAQQVLEMPSKESIKQAETAKKNQEAADKKAASDKEKAAKAEQDASAKAESAKKKIVNPTKPGPSVAETTTAPNEPVAPAPSKQKAPKDKPESPAKTGELELPKEPGKRGRPTKKASTNPDEAVRVASNKLSQSMIEELSTAPDFEGVKTHADVEAAAQKLVDNGTYDNLAEALEATANIAKKYAKKRYTPESMEENFRKAILKYSVNPKPINFTEIFGKNTTKDNTAVRAKLGVLDNTFGTIKMINGEEIFTPNKELVDLIVAENKVAEQKKAAETAAKTATDEVSKDTAFNPEDGVQLRTKSLDLTEQAHKDNNLSKVSKYVKILLNKLKKAKPGATPEQRKAYLLGMEAEFTEKNFPPNPHQWILDEFIKGAEQGDDYVRVDNKGEPYKGGDDVAPNTNALKALQEAKQKKMDLAMKLMEMDRKYDEDNSIGSSKEYKETESAYREIYLEVERLQKLADGVSGKVKDVKRDDLSNSAKSVLDGFSELINLKNQLSTAETQRYDYDYDKIPAWLETKIDGLYSKIQEMEESLPSWKVRKTILEVLRANEENKVSNIGAKLALELIDANPKMYEALALSFLEMPHGSSMSGYFDPYGDHATIFYTPGKGKQQLEVLPHEILHYTEQYLPTEIRDAIHKEWWDALNNKIESAKGDINKRNLDLLENIKYAHLYGGDELVYDLALSGNSELYRYANPSEWWTVNGVEVLSKWANSKNKAPLAEQLKKWYNGIIDALKRLLKNEKMLEPQMHQIKSVIKGLEHITGGKVTPATPGEGITRHGKPVAANVIGAGLTGLGIYHALTTGDVHGFALAGLGMGANPEMVRKVTAATKRWIRRKFGSKELFLAPAMQRWSDMNPEATPEQQTAAFKKIKATSIERNKGMRFRGLKPTEFLAMANKYVRRILSAGDKFNAYFTEKAVPKELAFGDWIDDIDTKIKNGTIKNSKILDDIFKLNVKVYDAAERIMHDETIKKENRPLVMDSEIDYILTTAFESNPELKTYYNEFRNHINGLSELDIESSHLSGVGVLPDEVEATMQKFEDIRDELSVELDNLGYKLKEAKADLKGKKKEAEAKKKENLKGRKKTAEDDDGKEENKILNAEVKKAEAVVDNIKSQYNAVKAKIDDADYIANLTDNIAAQQELSRNKHWLPYWVGLKSDNPLTLTLQRVGEEPTRYRLYGKSQGDLNMQLASVAAKENLQLRLVDGTTLSNEATVARLAEGEMGEGSTFVSDDGERWDMQRYDSRGDNYTNALYDAMDAYMNAMATGAAEGKLAKLAGEWLTNHRPKDKDSSKLMMLREMMQTTASGEIDFETMIRNVELLRADSLEELSKTSTLAAPSALESGQRLIHDVIRHLTNTSTDAERRGQQIETTKIQQETILDGFGDDELTQFLESHNQQLKSRTPVPYWRNAFSDFINSGSTLAQMAVLAFYIKSGVVNYVKGANAAIAEYGVITGKNISDPTSRQAIQVGMEAIKPLLKLRSRKRFHLDAGKFEKLMDWATAVQAKSQDFADNLTGKKGVADFVSNLSDADKTKLAEGDKKLISDLKQEVQSGIRRTQGSFRHYNLSPAQQKLLKYPIGKAMLAFTAPRINELNYVWHSLRNVKDPQSRARLLRYSAMTIMTVGAMGIPLITELRALVESGTGDREETEYDKMVAKLKEFAMENGVSEDAFNETRAMVEKGALANSITDTDIMSDDAITQMADFFGLSYATRMAKTSSDNWSDEDKSELEKVFAVVVSASPFAKNTYRSIAESVDGRKTDSKTNYIPGSKSSVGRVIRIASGFPKHSEKETGRRRLTENLETEQGFKDAAKNFIADLGGMTRIVFGNRPVTESSKAVPSAHKQKMYEYLLANPDKVKSTIRKANELTEEAQKEIDATKDAVKEWLNTPISDVKGINPNKAKMGGTVEDVLNQVLNNNLNPDYKSTDGILKSIIGSPNDDKYHETSVYGFYRKKAIIEALKNSGLAIRANFNPTTKLASGERLKAVPDAEQATEYAKNRVISIINGTVIAPE